MSLRSAPALLLMCLPVPVGGAGCAGNAVPNTKVTSSRGDTGCTASSSCGDDTDGASDGLDGHDGGDGTGDGVWESYLGLVETYPADGEVGVPVDVVPHAIVEHDGVLDAENTGFLLFDTPDSRARVDGEVHVEADPGRGPYGYPLYRVSFQPAAVLDFGAVYYPYVTTTASYELLPEWSFTTVSE